MKKLEDLFDSSEITSTNPLCEGCTILKKTKPCHSIMDYETLPQSDVLFLSDSFKYKFGNHYPFSSEEEQLLNKVYDHPAVYSASVKCPGVKEADMSPDNMVICRQHLEATIDKVKPKLVFVCGNLAMKMLVKKSGITDKRGKIYAYSTKNGHTTHVCPIYHPYSVSTEPRHAYLFERDIHNAYDKYILEKKGGEKVGYEVLLKVEDVQHVAHQLSTTTDTISCDIETTGLNFLTDEVLTIAISSKKGTWVIPLSHNESPFVEEPTTLATVWGCVESILRNPHNKKVFHNAKFDLKFLLRHGIEVVNVWDTKIMHHFINENIPKGLKDLVKLYFPTELEEF